jgi:hypothetical protein
MICPCSVFLFREKREQIVAVAHLYSNLHAATLDLMRRKDGFLVKFDHCAKTSSGRETLEGL